MSSGQDAPPRLPVCRASGAIKPLRTASARASAQDAVVVALELRLVVGENDDRAAGFAATVTGHVIGGLDQPTRDVGAAIEGLLAEHGFETPFDFGAAVAEREADAHRPVEYQNGDAILVAQDA